MVPINSPDNPITPTPQGKPFLADLCSGDMACGVFGHEQVVEDQARVGCEPANHGGNRVAGFGVQVEHADGEAAQSGSILGTVVGADTAAVFIPGNVEYMVTAVLDAPVSVYGPLLVYKHSVLWREV